MTYSMQCRNAEFGCLGTADDMGSGYCDACELHEVCSFCDSELFGGVECSTCDGCSECCVCPCLGCGEWRSQCACEA